MSIAELARRVWFFIRRDQVTADLQEEMRLHMELRAQREREAGFDESEAVLRASRQFGNRGRHVEESRDQWGMRWADELALDLRYAFRSLRRAPGIGAIVIITLSIGIGATTAMFGVMDAALFRPLPMKDADRLVVLSGLDVPYAELPSPIPQLDLVRLRREAHVYEALGAYAVGGLNLTGGGEPMRARVGLITPDALQLLGIQPQLGRLFTEDEERVDGPNVAILSHALWRRQFGADEAILRKTISLNDRTFEIVGVMPPRFAFPEGSELWIPMTVPMTAARAEIFRFIIETNGIGRLASGVTAERANAHLVTVMEEMGRRRRAGPPPEITRPMRRHFAGDADKRLWMVMGLAGLLLVAACANVCGLLLARWSARRREMAVRTAIGASRRRLLRQLVTESAVLALAGTLGGIALAWAGMRVFEALTPAELLALTPPRIDGRVLALALGLTVITAIGVGTLPAIMASRAYLSGAMKSSGTAAATRRGGRWLGGALVVVEVALAVVLLVGSGLLVKSLARLQSVDTGLRAEQVYTARIALSNTLYPNATARRQFHARVRDELARTPGLEHAAMVSTLPLSGEWNPQLYFSLPDRVKASEDEKDPSAEHMYATSGYFEALGIRLVAGRTFLPHDTAAVGGGAIISESLAKQYFPGTSAVGARMKLGRQERTIVGVVNDVRSTTLDGEQQDQLYLPFESSAPSQATLVARSSLPAPDAFARMRDAVQRVSPTQVVFDLKTMRDVTLSSTSEQRASGTLATTFALITLLLAAMGLYGLLAYGVVQRTTELGIRFALGAQRRNVVRSVVSDGLVLAALGALLGLAASYGATRLIRSQLYEVAPTDLTVFLAVPAVLIATALLAAAIPALRASRVDPIRALRAE